MMQIDVYVDVDVALDVAVVVAVDADTDADAMIETDIPMKKSQKVLPKRKEYLRG